MNHGPLNLIPIGILPACLQDDFSSDAFWGIRWERNVIYLFNASVKQQMQINNSFSRANYVFAVCTVAEVNQQEASRN